MTVGIELPERRFPITKAGAYIAATIVLLLIANADDWKIPWRMAVWIALVFEAMLVLSKVF